MIKTKKILIVDDEADIRNTLALLLIPRGYEVIEGGNGMHALQKLRAGLIPHLIICDISMPGAINGIQVLEFVRQHPKLKAIPFIILTGHSERDTVISAGEAGVSCFILKPFKSGELIKKIESFIGSSAPSESESDSDSPARASDDSDD